METGAFTLRTEYKESKYVSKDVRKQDKEAEEVSGHSNERDVKTNILDCTCKSVSVSRVAGLGWEKEPTKASEAPRSSCP